MSSELNATRTTDLSDHVLTQIIKYAQLNSMLTAQVSPFANSTTKTTTASTQTNVSSELIDNAKALQSIKKFVEPERDLESEIRDGLLRIRQLCDTIKLSEKPSKDNSAAQSLLSSKIKDAKSQMEIQSLNTQQSLRLFRKTAGLEDEASNCASLPETLRLTQKCRQYQNNIQRYEIVSKASSQFYSDIAQRYRSYEQAQELESMGCARSGFAIRLWQTEQDHMIGRMQRSSQFFGEILNRPWT